MQLDVSLRTSIHRHTYIHTVVRHLSNMDYLSAFPRVHSYVYCITIIFYIRAHCHSAHTILHHTTGAIFGTKVQGVRRDEFLSPSKDLESHPQRQHTAGRLERGNIGVSLISGVWTKARYKLVLIIGMAFIQHCHDNCMHKCTVGVYCHSLLNSLKVSDDK